MKELKFVTDPEEIRYARKVANMGTDQSREGKNYYSVASTKLMSHLGVVRVGCLVETGKPRDIKQGADQDFGSLKIMFYALFSDHQVELINKDHPGLTFVKLDNHGDAVFLTWKEYKHLARI